MLELSPAPEIADLPRDGSASSPVQGGAEDSDNGFSLGQTDGMAKLSTVELDLATQDLLTRLMIATRQVFRTVKQPRHEHGHLSNANIDLVSPHHTGPYQLCCVTPRLNQDDAYSHINEIQRSKPLNLSCDTQPRVTGHGSRVFEPPYAYIEFPNFKRKSRFFSIRGAVSPLMLPSPLLRFPGSAVFRKERVVHSIVNSELAGLRDNRLPTSPPSHPSSLQINSTVAQRERTGKDSQPASLTCAFVSLRGGADDSDDHSYDGDDSLSPPSPTIDPSLLTRDPTQHPPTPRPPLAPSTVSSSNLQARMSKNS